MALGHPDIQFKLISNDRVLRNYPASPDLRQRTINVLGNDTADRIYPIRYHETGLSVSGYCVNPILFRSTSSRIFLFVNKRLIYDRGLVAAIFQGYRGSLMKGKYPLAVICVDIDFNEVDVNVHPSKKEIRFYDHNRVYQAVSSGVSSALVRAREQENPYTHINIGSEAEQLSEQGIPPVQSKPLPQIETDPMLTGSQSEIKWPREKGLDPLNRIKESAYSTFDNPSQARNIEKESFQHHDIKRVDADGTKPRQSGSGGTSGFDSVSVIGQVMGTYILMEKAGDLVIVDQHAAHERIVFEKLMNRHQNMENASQNLLVPETLDLNFKEADVLNQILDQLADVGIRIEPFGGTTFVIKGIPAVIDSHQIQPVIRDILDSILSTGNQKPDESWLENTLVTMACHSAIRANKPMNLAEMKQLIQDLNACGNPMHCPHGRPTQISMTKTQMEKLFKRIV